MLKRSSRVALGSADRERRPDAPQLSKIKTDVVVTVVKWIFSAQECLIDRTHVFGMKMKGMVIPNFAVSFREVVSHASAASSPCCYFFCCQ